MEWKYAVPDGDLLDRIAGDPEVEALAIEAERVIEMRSAYLDTPDGSLRQKRIAVRRRMENDASVICVKTKLSAEGSLALRGEWETEDEEPLAALPELVERGAPAELLGVEELVCVCRADYRRRARLLRFPDGSEAELALDLGTLSASDSSIPLCEMELELKQGEPDASLAFAARLADRYGLNPEPKSKYDRALGLRGQP
jgi:inorganic triphosphatase YgiF